MHFSLNTSNQLIDIKRESNGLKDSWVYKVIASCHGLCHFSNALSALKTLTFSRLKPINIASLKIHQISFITLCHELLSHCPTCKEGSSNYLNLSSVNLWLKHKSRHTALSNIANNEFVTNKKTKPSRERRRSLRWLRLMTSQAVDYFSANLWKHYSCLHSSRQEITKNAFVE